MSELTADEARELRELEKSLFAPGAAGDATAAQMAAGGEQRLGAERVASARTRPRGAHRWGIEMRATRRPQRILAIGVGAALAVTGAVVVWRHWHQLPVAQWAI